MEFGELVDLARTRMDADRIPAVHLGLIDGEHEWTAALGIRDVRTGGKADDRTLFRIASITKTFTATALVRLAEEGKVDLDAPVRRYVPELTLPDEAAAQRITTRQLLLHTSGWVPGDQSGPDGPTALADGARLQANGEQVSPPGAYFSYNGVGYMVAGRVIEVATGRSYEDVIRTMILAPLGMSRTKFNTEIDDDDVAADHTVRDGAADTLIDATSGRWGLPSGGLRSTAQDMLRFARCHLGETDVLDARGAAAMAKPQVPLPPPGESKALSWFIRDVGGERLLMHLGGAIGQQSMLVICPRQRFGLVVLTNSAVGNAVTQAILGHLLGSLGIRSSRPSQGIALEAGRLAEYDGCYTQPGSDLILSTEGGGLAMRPVNTGHYAQRPTLPPAHLDFWEPDRVVGTTAWATGQYGDFLRGADGRIGYFRWSGRARRRIEKG